MSFELFAFRFQFRARTSLYFPAGKAGNIVRGALGRIFRKYACTPGCSGARVCEQRSSCAYARLFEPTAGAQGPSGFADWPRPFVIRAGHLDERRYRPKEIFHFDLHVFEMREPALAYFTFSFSQLMREGLGPGRAATELTAVYTLDSHGQEAARIFDGRALLEPQPLILPLRPGSAAVRRIRIQFLSPTELKGAGEINQQPEFGILFARARDRLHNLRKLYGAGPLTFDFKAAGERARQVNLLNSQLTWETHERRSGRTGQTHPLGGLVGTAEYEGDLGEFLPYLHAASWTGVGRQTTWGKGHIATAVLD